MADRKLKVGFVGCGGISRLYTDIYAGLTDVAQVVAVADLVPELARNRAGALTEAYTAEVHRQRALAFNARDDAARQAALAAAADAEAAARNPIRCYPDHETLLKDAEVEAMLLLTRPVVRGGPAIAALEAGRHLFTEGPMAKSVAEADAIVAAVEKAGVKYLSQCGGRYSRGMELARRAVASGLLGALALAKVEVNWFRAPAYYQRGWAGSFATEGGGAAFHHGRYVIDPFLSVVDSPIVEVTAYAGPFLRKIENDSLALALVRYANGAVGTVQGSLLHQPNPKTPTGRMEFIGADASMVIAATVNSSNAPAVLLSGGRETFWNAAVTFGSATRPEVVARLQALAPDPREFPENPSQLHQSRLWVRAILEDKPLPVPIRVPRAHVELSRAIYKSQTIGGTVRLPLETSDPFYTYDARPTWSAWTPGPAGA